MKKLLLCILLVLPACEQTLEPSDYDRSCEVDSDCRGYSIYCDHGGVCADFAASEAEYERIEEDRAALYCPPSPFEPVGACSSTSSRCEENTCVVD